MEQTRLLASQHYYAAHRSPPQIWNARSRILATPRSATHFARLSVPRNCSIARDSVQWGLANNHALDFGAAALEDCANRLFREQIQPMGVGKPDSNAPSFFSVLDGKKIALLAINDVGPAADAGILVASDRLGLNASIANARSHANFVACLVHWGVENSEKVTDEQRELARWLIDHGVDLVVGSHPHRVQALDFYHGCPIAYSLGNLVFDGAPTVESWNRGALLQIGLNENAQASSASLIPIVLENGFPKVDAAPKRETFTSR
jgi:poly-gamma-glutamate synthesis protein (capsule biosynthesis protein)